MKWRFSILTASIGLLEWTFAQSCNTTVLQVDTPSEGNVVFKSFSYCGGILSTSAYINNLAYNKLVNLYFTNRQNQSTPLTSIGLSYNNSIDGTSYELWGSSTPVYVDGITELLNITYDVVDTGEEYNQILNLDVVASGAPEPTLSGPPLPYATPKGFGDDITDFLDVKNGSQLVTSLNKMFVNINPAIEGAVDGVVVAGRSGPFFESKLPDYGYDWVRDSSLTMEVVQTLYAAANNSNAKQSYETILFQYALARAAEQNDPNLQTGLGEPKFYLNNTVYEKPWGRPQNDGPATAAITLIEFAESYLAAGGNVSTVKEKLYDSATYPTDAPIRKDLLFVASNWTSASFDLWEEESADHFYTRMVQRRALLLGARFAETMDDSETAATLKSAADALTATMSQFWDVNRGILLYEYGPVLLGKSSYLDAAVPLGLIHGYANDTVYSYTNDQVLSTIVRFVTSFIDVYPLANKTQTDGSGLTLGVPIGRYPEDVYNGTGTEENGGNPWYLTTAAIAQVMYAVSDEFNSAENLTVTNNSLSFFNYFVPDTELKVGGTYVIDSQEVSKVVDSLNGWGDAFLRTVKYYTPADGSLAEEYNRDDGIPQGCVDLTWSYASIITAAIQRAKTRHDDDFVRDLANLGFTPN
ncbi:Glucoamylase [Pseudocercospora fuligena]|uniref:glucan 1,4-alpha-glucosidase n=1 Tax=Pseudocercospora fuligena TaxID=685502 RepID=A0A8H6RKU8_9PEZI|nr:Glucoamylase [Pseudocercospora fuligena]